MSTVLDSFVVQDQSAAQAEQDQQLQPHTPTKSPIPLHSMQNSSTVNENTSEGFGTSNLNDAASMLPIMNKYAHLPTPQSPNNFANRTVGPPHTPESPMLHGSYPFSSRLPLDRSGPAKFPGGMSIHSPTRSQQIMTPESSPFIPRFDTSTPQYNTLSDTPLQAVSSPVKMEFLIASYTPSHRTPSPSSDPPHSSRLSSPFMAKATISEFSKSKGSRINSRPPASSAFVDDVFSSTLAGSVASSAPPVSTPPISPSAASAPGSKSPTVSMSPSPASTTSATNEMDRIRQTKRQEHEALENRRPEYLKRTKRTLAEADPTAFDDENARDRDRLGSVGIMESPVKGRRIKLFQETSEESFEESLMAGGYGRYRTAEWVRQPQPVVLPPGPAGPSNVIAHLEEAEQQPAPPSEKELKKQKRLAAFRSNNGSITFSKLYPVELEGKGRVLLDVPNNFDEVEPATTSPKKRGNTGGGGKRKKKAEPSAKEKRALAAAAAAEEMIEKPNWPDAEFPWRLRTEERTEQAKAEEEERLKWIERYFDRDTDEEDGDGSVGGGMNGHARSDDEEEVIPSSQWGLIFDDEDEHPVPYRAGRGKMVPLAADPDDFPRTDRKRSVYFPSDPADARAALLSKKSVRALSYRRQRKDRKDSDDGSEEEVLCICRGTDDGRELVQCDTCKMWYHLECIGINDIAELGREEDPWYCHDCDSGNVSESEVPLAEPYSEPDFAPTEESPPRVIRQADTPFFQASIQDSPTQSWSASRIPKTPTRGSGGSSDFGSAFTPSSRLDSSRHGPTTPRHRVHNVHIYSNSSPGPFDASGYDELPFDPTSTPSRGIRFGAPFATPKNSVYSSRAFHTPSRPSARSSGFPGSASFGAAGFLSSALSDRGNDAYSPYPRLHGYDDSPVRRTKSTEGPGARRIFEPTASSRVLFEDSSDSRAKGKEKAIDLGDDGVVM